MKKKLLPFLLAAVLLMSAAGCKTSTVSESGGETGSGTVSETGTTVEKTDGLPDTDLGGYEFVIAEGWYYDGSDMPDYTPGASDYTDAVLARNKEIEDRFNCTITYQFYQPTTFYDTALPVLMSGDKFADVMDPTLFEFGKFLNSNNLYDLSSLPNVDLTKSYWIKSFTDATRIGSGVYGTGADFANPSTKQYVFMFNRRLVNEQGLPDPYALVESGKWNWTALKEFVTKGAKDDNGDGKYDQSDVWSVSGGMYDAMKALYQTSGLKIFGLNNSGKYTYDLANAKSVNTLNKMKSLFTTPGAFYTGGGDYSEAVNHWSQGMAAGWIANLNFVQTTQMRDMTDDYGIVPLPLGEGQTQYVAPVDHNAPIVCVPSVITNPEATGTILTAMAFASQKDREVWNEQLKNMYFRDDETFNMVSKYIFPNIILDPALFYGSLSAELSVGINGAIGDPIIGDQSQDSGTIINSVANAVQEQIDEITSRLGTTKK